MIVMKFGGTSLRDAAAIRSVCEIVRSRLDSQPVIVVSAHSGVTDRLVSLAESAVSSTVAIDDLIERHAKIREDLGIRENLHEELFRELQDLCRGIHLVGELSPRSRDYILSFGERLSARTVAAAMTAAGLPARAIDSFDIGVRTDSRFGNARLAPDEGRILAGLRDIRGLPVVTGYIAKDAVGNITTLGRNGSDLSAAYVGNAIDAEEIQIWTDVDGVLTADPRVVPSARPIAEMSYDEAAELANHGGKVLHPASLAPAIEKSIPVRVLNTHRPDSAGTLIVKQSDDPNLVVRCIAHKRRVTIVNVESSRMLAQSGFLARIFGCFQRWNISVDMVATSEISVSITLDNIENLDEAVKELEDFASVSVEHDLGLVCVVGHGIKNRLGVPARVLDPLHRAGVVVRMISLGALKVNVSLVVDGGDLDRAVRALHDEFFDEEGRDHG
ncbi:MAG: aspartate kinase [Planctomycetes bacterium]|nr:aspartate kinase [Planctomycetota bacterium]